MADNGIKPFLCEVIKKSLLRGEWLRGEWSQLQTVAFSLPGALIPNSTFERHLF